MKNLNTYILEKFRISKSRLKEAEYLLVSTKEDGGIFYYKKNIAWTSDDDYIKIFLFKRNELINLVKDGLIPPDYSVHQISYPEDEKLIEEINNKTGWGNIMQAFNVDKTIKIKDIMK